jgi:hypothetical protein
VDDGIDLSRGVSRVDREWKLARDRETFKAIDYCRVRLSPEDRAWLEPIAAAHGLTMGHFLFQAAVNHVESGAPLRPILHKGLTGRAREREENKRKRVAGK